MGHNPWGHKELDMTEKLIHTFTSLHQGGRFQYVNLGDKHSARNRCLSALQSSLKLPEVDMDVRQSRWDGVQKHAA